LKDTSEAFRKFFHDLSVSVEKPDCDEKYEEFRERYKQLQKEELTLKEIAIVSDDTQDVIKRLKQHKNFNKKKIRQFVKKIDKEIVYSSNKKESENSNKISRVIRGKKSFNRYIQKYINNHKMSLKKSSKGVNKNSKDEYNEKSSINNESNENSSINNESKKKSKNNRSRKNKDDYESHHNNNGNENNENRKKTNKKSKRNYLKKNNRFNRSKFGDSKNENENNEENGNKINKKIKKT